MNKTFLKQFNPLVAHIAEWLIDYLFIVFVTFFKWSCKKNDFILFQVNMDTLTTDWMYEAPVIFPHFGIIYSTNNRSLAVCTKKYTKKRIFYFKTNLNSCTNLIVILIFTKFSSFF